MPHGKTSRHGIVTAITQGVAAADALECQPGAFECTVFLERFQRVARAGWREPAMTTQERADGQLVAANEEL